MLAIVAVGGSLILVPQEDFWWHMKIGEWIQANGSIWRLAEDQSKLVASFLIAANEGHERAAWLRALKAKGHDHASQSSYVKSERHRLEANYYDYRRQARRLLKGFGAMASAELKSWRNSKAGRATQVAKKKTLSPT